tara:strand:- start:65 stop:1462 length:1398 start_codon:yes stop_codon:yes gene_type:complete
MTSRVLQENTDFILTENSNVVINDNFISTDGFVTGSPVITTSSIGQQHSLTCTAITTSPVVVSTSNISQQHSLSCNIIVTGSSVVSTSSISQQHSLSCNIIVSGNAVVNNAVLNQAHSLQVVSFTTGQPVVSNSTMIEDEAINVPSFTTGTPVVQTTAITQQHNLLLYSILTPSPDVGEADDPTKQEIEELEAMFGGWGRRGYEVPDGKLVQAEREVQMTYGDVISIDKKAKSLIKFGKSGNLTANNTLETIWTVGGNETYVTGNTIANISSSSASDTEEVTIESHTVAGTGVNSVFTFVTQNVTLNGQNPVSLSTPVSRVSRVYNNGSSELVGRVVVYENTAVTGGIPDDITKVHIDIPSGFQQSFKSATTFSSSDYFVLTGIYGSVSKKQAASVDFYLEERIAGKVFRQLGSFTASSEGGPFDIRFDPAIIIKKNSDVRFRADTSTNNSVVFAIFKGYLASII